MLFLTDGNGDFARGLGLTFDGRPLDWASRYAMWAMNGAIQHLAVEPNLTVAVVSTAYTLFNMLES